MKTVIIDRYAEITKGVLKGQGGNVIFFDKQSNLVKILFDEYTVIEISSDNIKQEVLFMQKQCECGCIFTIKETENDGRNLCHPCGRYF